MPKRTRRTPQSTAPITASTMSTCRGGSLARNVWSPNEPLRSQSAATYRRSLPQPMSLSNDRFQKNGSTQNAESRPASGPTTASQAVVRTPGRTSHSASRHTSEKKAAKRWVSPASASRAAAAPRCRPVSMPRAATPKNTTAKVRPSELANSPAMVESRLPP